MKMSFFHFLDVFYLFHISFRVLPCSFLDELIRRKRNGNKIIFSQLGLLNWILLEPARSCCKSATERFSHGWLILVLTLTSLYFAGKWQETHSLACTASNLHLLPIVVESMRECSYNIVIQQRQEHSALSSAPSYCGMKKNSSNHDPSSFHFQLSWKM